MERRRREGGGEKFWKDFSPDRTRAGTNDRKRLSWALRARDKLGVRRPAASPGTVHLPPSHSPHRQPKMSQPHQPTTGRATGGSGRLQA